ncbi:MAG: hypothetical protein HY368_02375 [Candidatus Aenigmarchaeota archaeon]|nr:hypothetical protein [Candidatus Aenigmarchaeota archaeon]
MKLLDGHMKNAFYTVVGSLASWFVLKTAGVTIDTGFWIMFVLLLLIYFEIWDMSDKKK